MEQIKRLGLKTTLNFSIKLFIYTKLITVPKVRSIKYINCKKHYLKQYKQCTKENTPFNMSLKAFTTVFSCISTSFTHIGTYLVGYIHEKLSKIKMYD
jgi:hypothetical protein